MTDNELERRQKILNRICELLEENERAVPFLVGYLTYGQKAEQMERAVDAYFAHNEAIATIREARRMAEEAAQEARPQD